MAPRSTGAAADFAWGRDRFIAEGRTLAAFHRRPGVVQVHDFLEANGTAYLVMELVTRPHPARADRATGAARRRGLDGIFWPLLDGLEQVHAVGFLHRDIKPANILVDANGHPVLIDFGASRAAVAGRSQSDDGDLHPGLRRGRAVHGRHAGTVDRYLRPGRHGPSRDHRPAPPNAIDRIIDDTYWPSPTAGFLSRDAARRHRCRPRRARRPTARNRSRRGGRCCLPLRGRLPARRRPPSIMAGAAPPLPPRPWRHRASGRR